MRWLARVTLIMLVTTMLSVAALGIYGAGSANANTATPALATTLVAATGTCEKNALLGVFVPWYQYLDVQKDDTGSCGVKNFNLLPDGGESSDVPLILLAVVDDLLRLAGLVAVVFVIMGGVQYATSQGNPDATSKAQSTILNALIGLAIAIVAVTFVSFLGRALG